MEQNKKIISKPALIAAVSLFALLTVLIVLVFIFRTPESLPADETDGTGVTETDSGAETSEETKEESNDKKPSEGVYESIDIENFDHVGAYVGENVLDGRVHTWAFAPIDEEEDTSNTLAYMPLRDERIATNDMFNKPALNEDVLVPGASIDANGKPSYAIPHVGYDNFIFCADSFSDYDGTSLYPDVRLQGIESSLIKKKEYIEGLGKKLYILIVPNKNTIYSEYMPEDFTMGEYRRFDQVVELIEKVGITVIDGRESLLAAKDKNPERLLYYKTDTHWNNHGGFEVYTQLMKEIKKDFPNAVLHTRQDYQINYCETYMKDQALYLGYYDATHEIGPVYTLKSGESATLTDFTEKEPWGQFQYCYQWNNGFSDRLYNFQWTNSYNTDAPSMYMIRDSYSIALTGFLKDSFYKSTYDWTFNLSRSAVEKSDADVVIIEVCEKNITDLFNRAALYK